MKRPIVTISIGYIIGILTGLYFNKSIVLFYLIFFIIYLIHRFIRRKSKKNEFNFLSIKRYLRYLKLILTKKVILTIIIISVVSNLITIQLNKKYDTIYNELNNEIKIIATICSNKKEKQYKNIYKIKIEKINNNIKYKNIYLFLNTPKNINLEFGDKIQFEGEYSNPSEQRNYRGFDYKKYLKSLNVAGTVKAKEIKVLKKNNLNVVRMVSNQIFLKIKQNIENTYKNKESSLILGIMLGYTDNIENNIKDEFSSNNISHILAISGMHISYIMIGISVLFNKLLGKRKTRILTIFLLIIYVLVTGFFPSIIRAEIMGIMLLLSFLIYRKSDIWTNISLSLLCILITNPFLILNTGLILSYGGTIGIIIFQKNVLELLQQIKIKKKLKSRMEVLKTNSKKSKFIINTKDKILEMISVTISAQIVLMPIIMILFNKIGFSFIFINLLITFIIGPVVILGFIQIITSFLFFNLGKFISYFLNPLINILLLISKLGSKLPLTKIYVSTPQIYILVVYYFLIFILNYLFKIYNLTNLNAFQKRIKNLIQVFKYKIIQNKRMLRKILILFIVLLFILNVIPKNLKIYFIDIGQGDGTLIITPNNKKILIDGGGSESSEFDVGKSTLLPYLLARKVKKLDYVIISHFDQDHCGALLYIIRELKVGTVIIGKQYEISENYNKFKEIVKEKNIKVQVVEAGDKIKIEKNIDLDILWPSSNSMISENAINNNSLVCKLNYKKFSILFTGDIEKVAEDKIVSKYMSNKNCLNSTVLKVAHHGSKTSSTIDFLNAVNSKYALIGVGENNKFGHPADSTIKNLQEKNIKIYRTDKMGEISIKTNGIKLKINYCINLTK